uniref:Hemocyanin type 2 n=1 Tax=Haliotis discus hannai TaxID=42344 RepID=A0A7R6MNQ8_HALDH|nr:hemocyanin type 2 [Haliotis discus hannai]
MHDIQQDEGSMGYQAIAAYHGAPAGCVDGHGRKVACCLHGMPSFPLWHRLYVVQMERALMRHKSTVSIPYWDWTQQLTHLPDLVSDPLYVDPEGGKAHDSAWYRGNIKFENKKTARAVDDRLFENVGPGEHTRLFEGILDALEQDEFCKFEIQFELAHNAIHYLVGGRHTYSMSHLEYTSYDPIFFLHHSNTDRIFTIWQRLQQLRGKDPNSADCAHNLIHKSMEPFHRESNPLDLTRENSKPVDTFDYAHLGYQYDDLTLNGMTPEELNSYLHERSGKERVFASFRLSGFGGSANVVVYACRPAHDEVAVDQCIKAGDFFVLGGPTEMPWRFYRAFHYDVTDAVSEIDHDGHAHYYVKAALFSVNGSALPSDLLPQPTIAHRPARGHVDEPPAHVSHANLAVRKDINHLTREEVYELRRAMEKFQNDKSVDGYQATVEYHGLPARCPFPEAINRIACCIHGMATFPHWHRLFVTQVEDALIRRGSPIGVPYWDWTQPMAHLPGLADNETYQDPISGESKHNPFHDAAVAFENGRTERQTDARLFEQPHFGKHTRLFDSMVYAFEQDDFCDFEVQFEMTHNNIHAWIGGGEKYSMSSLHYTAFDPIFYLHHSNTDRLWAIWQALQIRRNKPYKAHCAWSEERQPLKPFAFSSPLNNNAKTYKNSIPTNVYDYEGVLGYAYDDLNFGGMDLGELEEYIDKQKQTDRTYAGFFLSHIGTSANVDIYINHAGEESHVGTFAVLGGEKEMKWGFDRMYRYDITDEMKQLNIHAYDGFDITVKVTDVDGTELSSDLIPPVALIFERGQIDHHDHRRDTIIRKNVDNLTPEEVNSLRRAMGELQSDKTAGGFQQIAAFHGEPKWCPSPDAEKKFSCCVHGMAVFPHWHRLLTVQGENALRKHGYVGALPYWDWSRPLSHLPALVSDPNYTDAISNTDTRNPWFSGHIDSVGADTTRSIRHELYEAPGFGHYTGVAKQVLLALEQDDFCNFEIQFEIAHNFIHALVGGSDPYGMASLRYTTYDPLFYLHHSNTDRLWAIWQALQKYRGKPYNSANCAIASMRKPLQPFGLTEEINPDDETRQHAVPFRVFDYKNNFKYEYDTLDFNGLSISQLDRELSRRQSHDRVFAGFLLHGIKQSALVKFFICRSDDDCDHYAGEFYILGDEAEMPWGYDRLYKYEITEQLTALDLHIGDRFFIRYEAFDLHASSLGSNIFPKPSVIHDTGAGHHQADEYIEVVTAASHIRKNLKDLSEGEVESLRSAFLQLQNDGVYENIAKFHGKPGLCDDNGRKVACCVHGMPTFPQWHRLYVLQVENALLERGSAVSVPYWDWTEAFDKLPSLIADATYFNSRKQSFDPNPFFRGKIGFENAVTTRDPQPELYQNRYYYQNVMLALEQDNYCDFEIQFEMVHNVLHAWLGGRATYSISSLDYSAFDPVFFLHHANTDRLWAIWQELQRYRKKPYNEADCAINLMRKPLRPFDNPDLNHDPMTFKYSRPADGFDYQNHFGYKYDNLEFNHFSIPRLEEIIQSRQRKDRVFAAFLLHNIGTSATVEIFVCVTTDRGEQNCENKAGSFAVLGGETEMAFNFDRLYKFEISDTLRDLGLQLDSHDFDLNVKIQGVNGSYLDAHILPEPSLIFEPGSGSHLRADGQMEEILVRKEVNSLTVRETASLIHALRSMQEDHSPDGFQAIASFHALPPLCPSPSAAHRYACCVHGMATFPQWHRLYTVQFQDALRRHGARSGVPYWDWLRPQSQLPELVTMETYHDPWSNKDLPNPFYRANIEFEGEGVTTHRQITPEKLFVKGGHIFDNWFFKQAILALEQENYCDFEIQFEILHNGVHTWVGGNETYSLGHLHYASYDPLFYLHHSQTDRIWAIWQELQIQRGLSGDEAHCALEQMREPLKPFSFGAPYNLNQLTYDFSRPEDTFDYKKFGYEYDNLEFLGMSISELDQYIIERQEDDRVLAGFLLSGFGDSASVDFQVCRPDSTCQDAGYFTVLGGSAEMAWTFDRLFKYDITDTLEKMHLRYDDPFTISHTLTANNGTVLRSSLIPTPSVIFQRGHRDINTRSMPPNRVRHELTHLSARDLSSLKSALRDLQNDDGPNGYQALAAFHGLPAGCHDSQGHEIACCIHGMPTFPQWHRLYTLQMEQALRQHGSSVAIPYWDWTKPISELPDLFTSPEYYDPWHDAVVNNPFSKGFVKFANTYTVRDTQDMLFDLVQNGETVLFDQTLLVLEQTDYCDFEVQFEVLHNVIHYLVGGRQTYALSSLHYASYDPLFFIHHSFVDKIWVVWQALQKRRKLPYKRADCAVNLMTKPMRPFDSEMNHNIFTKTHAVPNTLYDYEKLYYSYDNLELGGRNLDQLQAEIDRRRSHARVFAGFLLHGIGTSADVRFWICRNENDCHRAGIIFILGGAKEMPWSFDRNFKFDITNVLKKANIDPEDVFDAEEPFYIKVEIHAVNKTMIPSSVIPAPTIIYSAGEGHALDRAQSANIAGSGVRKDVTTLTVSETENLRHALQAVIDDSGPNGYQAIASFHGSPAMCEMNGHKVACCAHGMASFPHWHRLYVKQMEDALAAHGSHIGIPYWDWTTAFTELPALVTDSNNNPFHDGHIDHLGVTTSRSPRDMLFNDPEQGSESFFYRQVLLALEQTDYCQFEVQFELTHNAIHSWTGGRSPYGMSTLEFTAYDPLFWLHHSNTDRIWAVWQALQKYRGLPYNEAHCEIQVLKQPLRPFSDAINHNPITKANARAIDSFDYERFNYQYDTLSFHGHSIPELNDLLEARKREERTFAAFLLRGIKCSADVVFDICRPNGDCVFAGTFAVLGGELEMPWSFDRLFRYDITKVMNQLHLQYDSDFSLKVKLVATNGTELSSDLLKPPTIEHDRGMSRGPVEETEVTHQHTDGHVHYHRKEVDSLSLDEANNLKNALYKLQNDRSLSGYEAISGYHGYPSLCPAEGDDKYPCCVHGMAIFPHWHRLLTIQLERALNSQGALLGVPYWDWTKDLSTLPAFFSDASNNNPFYKYHIAGVGHDTVREPNDLLFNQPKFHGYDYLYYLALTTLEENNYCDFEVQYEILHNAVHSWLGGTQKYSMSTLEYSAFDPVFMILHSGLDRLWIIWQELQKLRRKPYNFANCARHMMDEPLAPFSYPSVNQDEFTRANSKPSTVFDSHKFGYHYDNLNVRGHNIQELNTIINNLRNTARIYAGFVLSGIETSASVKIYLRTNDKDEEVGTFTVLGGEREMPWAYERVFKYDITEVAERLGLGYGDTFNFRLEITSYDGVEITKTLPNPFIIYRPASHDYDVLVIPVGSNLHIPPKVVVKRGTRIEFHPVDESVSKPVVDLGSYTALFNCVVPPFTYHGFELNHVYSVKPGDYYVTGPTRELCQNADVRIHIHVEDESWSQHLHISASDGFKGHSGPCLAVHFNSTSKTTAAFLYNVLQKCW